MSSSRAGDSLSFRLRTLHSHYSHERNVWDIGCDHGHLGLSFIEQPEVEHIHLVDPSEPVISSLIHKYKDSYISKASFYHQTGQSLSITTASNCIFIAGMGGKEIGEIISSILPQLSADSKIVFSPHRKILELRSLLHTLPLKLESEMVIEEDDQFYQILTVRPGSGEKVSLFGEALWNGSIGERYRDHQLKFFGVHRDEASSAYVDYLKSRNPLNTTDFS